jgi:pantothenate kinase type III
MILTIDIGNTRIKFAQWCEDVIVSRGAAVYNVADSSTGCGSLQCGG